MLPLLLNLLSRLLARIPEPALAVVTVWLGEAVLWLAPGRRRLILSNLNHAFPEQPAAWRRSTARQCSRRLIETGLLSLASPNLDERRIRRIARLAPPLEKWAREKYGTEGKAGPKPAASAKAGPKPAEASAKAEVATVFATLHLALWESQTWFTLLSPTPLPEFGIIFRPLGNADIDAYVKQTRERFGMRLLSRKQGFADSMKILRGGGCLGILFDQNAGHQGALTTFFGRVCSTTELPGILAAKFEAEVRTFFPRRTGFWRVEFGSDPVVHDGTADGITIALNRWLESALTDHNLCASWLWAHDRWRNQDMPSRRLRLESRRNLLADEMRLRGWSALPRRTRVWIRMPNWLGDAMIALPLLRAIRASRPDAEIHLLAKTDLVPLLEAFQVADRLHPLPAKSAGYYRHFPALGRTYPDLWILLTNSFRGDMEAWLARSPQRFGIVRPGRPRPLLTHAYDVPTEFDEARNHQIRLWENFLRHFGLDAAPDLKPFVDGSGPPGLLVAAAAGASPPPVGLIPGSENNPAKRWPAANWRRLISAFPDERFVLFGTARDSRIAAEIAAGHSAAQVDNLAGQTDLLTFARRLRRCRLLVANDTGGMHLANALGVPVIALFGPTNPVRTGPVFAAARRILQPPGCPPTGGSPLAGLSPETVIACVKEWNELPLSPCRS